ncbi:MAG: GNAT family N-acetyltransferase [Dehalococcoidia bacterium]|nr:GNAT family N-acetyltransferase [Dehalococcoidia bacterium]
MRDVAFDLVGPESPLAYVWLWGRTPELATPRAAPHPVDGTERAAVAHVDGRAVGVLRFEKDSDTLRILVVWTDPAYRRQGLAQQLGRMAVGPWARRGWIAAATEGGWRFAQRMQQIYPRLRWTIRDDRPPRQM